MKGKEAIIIFIVGSLLLVFVVNPNFGKEIFGKLKDIEGWSGGPKDVSLSKLAETYRTDYISQYLWKNYSNENIKLSNVDFGLSYLNERRDSIMNARSVDGVDYYFCSTNPLVHREKAVYLIDSKNVINEAKRKYSAPKFTIIGVVQKKSLDFGGFWSHNYENAVVIVATDIRVHP